MDIAMPYVSYALTSGPTAPEATSFEPVDTTDMVNLATGDLVYNIPLLEVPGPSGGYPLSLSYHAGIQPNMDASWVGLGWTLNPGAISRTVSGYPDDHNAISGTQRTFWEGGETHTIEVGGVIGVAGAVGVSAGLSIAHDTYRGFGVGHWVGGNIGLDVGSTRLNAGVNARAGVSAFGSPYASAGIGVGIGLTKDNALELGLNVGVKVNNNGVSGYASSRVSVDYGNNKRGRDLGSASLVGASIATSRNTVSGHISVGGASKLHNSKAGKVSSESWDITPPLPLIHLSYGYQRYWVDETEVTSTNGSLYYPKTSQGDYKTVAYDTYSLLDPNLDGGIVDNPDADKVLGGSFPDYDSYSVTAQGLGGNMRPYYYQGYLARQSKFDEDQNHYEVRHQHLGYNNRKPQFRFVGDFSNTYDYNRPDGEGFTTTSSDIDYSFGGAYTAGEDGFGYDATNNQLAGSKHVEYFTNTDITSGDAMLKGFIEADGTTGFSRPSTVTSGLEDQIGGYKITNSSGVTYHYSLPAYSYDEFQRTDNTEEAEGHAFNTSSKPTAYAYTWFLTGVTGPDFVDRGTPGVLDDEDWGYWVSFDYGKWSDSYHWRNPATGAHKDVDSKFETYSSGTKELYYLNQVRTKTHTAFFLKEIRKDAKGVIKDSEGGWGFEDPPQSCGGGGSGGACYKPPQIFSSSTMRLSKILLYQNEAIDFDLNLVMQNSPLPGFGYGTTTNPQGAYYHFTQNVLDLEDYDASTLLGFYEGAVRSIEFDHSYDLMPGTTNSFDFDYNAPDAASIATKYGKLTLDALSFRGKRDQSIIPPMSFKYENESEAYNKDAYDIWGFYKNDFNINDLEINESLARFVTNESASKISTWSLNEITSSLGSTIGIEYESDSYEKSILAKQSLMRIKDAINLGSGRIKLILFEDQFDIQSLGDIEEIGVYISRAYYYHNSSSRNCDCVSSFLDDIEESYVLGGHSENVVYPAVESYGFDSNLDTNYIIVDDQGLAEEVFGSFNYSIKWPFSDANCPFFDCDYQFNSPDFILGGFVVGPQAKRYGGGIRVKSVNIASNSFQRNTSYKYTNGKTSFEPFIFLEPLVNPDLIEDRNQGDATWDPVNAKKRIAGAINKNYSRVLANSREIIAPGVIYGKVGVEEYVNDNKLPGYTEYEFQTFQEDMVSIDPEDFAEGSGGNFPDDNINFTTTKTRRITVKDKMSQVGALKSITLFDDNGNKISETLNHYLLPESFDFESVLKKQFNNQGRIEETFAEARIAREEDGNYTRLGVLSERIQYPNIQTGQTSTNYKTGVSTTTKNLAFDFFSGSVTKTLTIDSYGNYHIAEITPAYRKYSSMGLAIDGGANMLTQEAAAVSYLKSSIGVNEIKLYAQVSLGEYWDLDYVITDLDENLSLNDWIEFETEGQTFIAKLVEDISGENTRYIISFFGDRPTVGFVGVNYQARIFRDKSLLSATARTWSDEVAALNATAAQQSGIWRKHRSYSYLGNDVALASLSDNLYPYTSFKPFDAWSHNQTPTSAQWQKNSEITLYDVNSHALEAMDVNGNYAATKMDNKQERVYATVANATYNEFAFSGAEDEPIGGYFGGKVKLEGEYVEGYGHTGAHWVLSRNGNDKGFSYEITDVQSPSYHASFWSTEPGATIKYRERIGGVWSTEKVPQSLPLRSVQVGDEEDRWYLHRYNFEVSSGVQRVEVWTEGDGNTLQDDFRVHPTDATMTSYVYNEWGELEYILDANNIYTKYEYDAMGRLAKTFRETFEHDAVWASNVDYHYRSDQNLTFQGDVAFSRLDYNTYNLRVDFDTQGSGNYSSVWNIGGTTFNRSGNSISYDVPSEGNKDVIVQITDNNSGLSFMAYDRIYFDICPTPGMTLGSYCEVNNDGCKTGWVIIRRADGFCGENQERVFDDISCNNNANPSCPQ